MDQATTFDRTIQYGGKTFNVHVKKLPSDEGRWRNGVRVLKKARIYVHTDEAFSKLSTASAPLPKGGMFPHLKVVFGNGRVAEADDTLHTQREKYPEVDAAWDAFNAALKAGMRHVLREVEDLTGSKKMKHSIHAGCAMCPCSPGFICDDLSGQEMWVTVKEA